jgi:hypothetical protein
MCDMKRKSPVGAGSVRGEIAPADAYSGGLFPAAAAPRLSVKDEQMTDFSHDGGVFTARLIGAVAGSAISLVYLLPKGRREAAGRLLTGVACGLIFGGPTGVWCATRLGLAQHLSAAEIMLAGATLASFTAWWGLGLLVRLTTRAGGKTGI